MDLLVALTEQSNRIVPFEALYQAAWPGRVVEDNNLSVQMSMLRSVLGKDRIITVRGRGYQFVLLEADPPTEPTGATPRSLLSPAGQSAANADNIDTEFADSEPAGLQDEFAVRLAVLPLEQVGEETGSVGLGDVLTDLLINRLATTPLLQVTSRVSTMGFRGRSRSVAEVRRRLGVQYVVSGRWWRLGERLTLTLELDDAQSAAVCWSQTMHFTVADAFTPDSDLVMELSAAVAHAVTAAQLRQVHGTALPNLSSHVMLLRAIQQMFQQQSNASFEESRRALQWLHERSPSHPLPLAWLAQWHIFQVVQGWSPDRDHDGQLAHRHALEALERDPNCALALTMLANVHTTYLGDLDTADALFQRATQACPSEALAWLQWANERSFRGDGQQAVAFARHALRLSPLDPARHFFDTILASAALSAGDYHQAIASARASLAINASHVSTHRVLAIALSLAGLTSEARTAVTRLRELQPALTVRDFVARSPGRDSGLAGKFGQALKVAGLPP